MPQRERAPPDEWEERRDNASRRAFERFEDKLRAEFEETLSQLQVDSAQHFKNLEDKYVSWKGFAVFIVPLVSAIMALVAVYVAPVKESIAGVGQRVDKVEATVSKRLDEQDKKIERVGADVGAVMRVTVDGKPRSQAKREWETKTGVPRIDVNP